MTPDEEPASASADHSLDQELQQQQREYQRRMSAPAAYAVVTSDATDALDTLAVATRPSRRSSLVGAYDYPPSQPQHQLYQHHQSASTPTPTHTASMNSNDTASASSRRSSVVDDWTHQPSDDADDAAATTFASYLLAPRDSEMTETDAGANTNADAETDGDGTSRKRTERRTHGCETMFSMDELFSRDLRITGVSKKGTSWRYHIEVLDVRHALMPFTTTTESRDSTAASSPASSSIASMASLPSAPPSSAAYTLPPLVRYTVMRRYNDFRQLYLYLVDYYGPELLDWLPKFPDGGLVSYFRGDDPKLLQFRKEQLQKFLRALDAHDDTKWSRAFRLFLNPEIDELTTIGGASFATLVENYGATPSTTAGAPPLSSTTSSSSYWEGGIGLSRINTNSGYVSLSHIKSPEIRFKKQPTDARGDWKRRKIARANRGEEAAESEHRGDAKRPRRVKRLELDEPQMHEGNHSDTGDEEEDDDDETDSPKKSSTELMKLLSLAPAGEPNQ